MTKGGLTKRDLVAVRQADGSIRIRSKAARQSALRRWRSDDALRASFAPFTIKKGKRRRSTGIRSRTVKRRRV
jgi:hypothetical protein